MNDALVLDCVRTPVGRNNGALAGVRPDELAADCLGELVARTGIDPTGIEDVVMGCVTQLREQGVNVARNAALIAGFPITVPGTTVNRLCGSSQQAIHFAAQAVMAGVMDLTVAAGVESMSRIPMGSDVGPPSERMTERFDIINQGLSAELVAQRWELSREDVDAFGLESHRRAVRAIDEKHFERETFTIQTGNGPFEVDEGPRRDTSAEKMASLNPAFRSDGLITAGNSSQISDGSAALLIGNRATAERLGLRPRARIVSFGVAGVDPTLMLSGPIPATARALEKAGLSIDQIDLFEVNEAFAAVPLAWMKETGVDPERVNVNGGAIALGHPLGATGSRLMTTLIHEMERREARYGLVTMCIGFGQGTATIVERIAA